MYDIKKIKKGEKTFYEVFKAGEFFSSHPTKAEAQDLIGKAGVLDEQENKRTKKLYKG